MVNNDCATFDNILIFDVSVTDLHSRTLRARLDNTDIISADISMMAMMSIVVLYGDKVTSNTVSQLQLFQILAGLLQSQDEHPESATILPTSIK